jgi:ribonucleoside-diphosphate reductase subunit M2
MPDIDTLRPIYAGQADMYPLKAGESSTTGAGPSVQVEKGKEEKVTRRFPEEEDEDLLRESTDRFVLFPIKDREVGRKYP